MSALDTLERIITNEHLYNYPFRYCLVGDDKIPYSLNESRAHPNDGKDFCSLEELSQFPKLEKYAGIGVSIIESKICAIDVDKCFKDPFILESIDDRGKDIIELFKDKAYIEFSFSGRGLRILFIVDNIPNYTEAYYIKNDKNKIEYYQPGNTARYVTITGKVIFDNELSKMTNLDTIYLFLNKYMTRPKTSLKMSKNNDLQDNNNLSLEQLLKKVKSLYLKDIEFQELWFMDEEDHITKLHCNIQGQSKESTTDYKLLQILYNNIVEDKEKLREIFESSFYFKSKDKKHLKKWYYNNYRYYNYMFERL